ncbi:MAG TPA: TolC family protein, partial [Rectinemataceae bacterium]|nr:TolC family protein [Rectinemataceae bacterium]
MTSQRISAAPQSRALLGLVLLAASSALWAQVHPGAQTGPSGTDLRRAAAAPYGNPGTPASSWSTAVPADLGPAALPAEAGPAPRSLGVEDAVNLALDRNLGLAGARLDVAVKQRKAESSWNQFLPQVDVNTTLSRFNMAQSSTVLMPANGYIPTTTIPNIGTAQGLYSDVYYMPIALPTWNLSASLSAQLVLNAAMLESMKGARIDYEAGLISYASATRKLERDVRKSFYGLLLLQENMELMQENIDNAKRRVDQAEANYKAGLVPELSLLSAQVAWENMKPALDEMRVAYASALDGFALILGLPRGSELQLKGEILPSYAELDAGRLISDRLGDRFDVQGLVKTLEGLKSGEKQLHAQLFTPSLILGWNYDPTFMGDPFKDDLFKGNPTLTQGGGDAWQQRTGMFRATLAFRLNGLFPKSQEYQGLLAMRDGIEQARTGLALTIRGAEAEIDSLVRRLDKSRKSSDALKLNVDLADRAYRLSDLAYKAGAKDLLEVQSAELELRKAQVQVITENYNY